MGNFFFLFSFQISPAYGLIPLHLLDVLVVLGIVFAVLCVGILRNIHAYSVVLICGHFEVAVDVAPRHAGPPLFGKTLLDNDLIQCLLPLLIVVLRQLCAEEVASIVEEVVLLVELCARAAVAVVYQIPGVGKSVANLLLHDVQGMAGGTGKVFDGTGLHHRERQFAVLSAVIDVDDRCVEGVLLEEGRYNQVVGSTLGSVFTRSVFAFLEILFVFVLWRETKQFMCCCLSHSLVGTLAWVQMVAAVIAVGKGLWIGDTAQGSIEVYASVEDW